MKRIASLFIIIAILFNLNSCIFVIPEVLDALGDQQGDLKDEPDEWVSSSSIDKGVAVTVVKGRSLDLSDAVLDLIDTEGATWVSLCDAVASLEGGVVTGNRYGRTTVTVTDALGKTLDITVTVELLLSTKSDYDISGRLDNTVYKVSSKWEADRLIDEAISLHKSRITP